MVFLGTLGWVQWYTLGGTVVPLWGVQWYTLGGTVVQLYRYSDTIVLVQWYSCIGTVPLYQYSDIVYQCSDAFLPAVCVFFA